MPFPLLMIVGLTWMPTLKEEVVTKDLQLTFPLPLSSEGSRHFDLTMTSASYCSLSVSISPILRKTTQTSTRTCN